MEHNTSDVNTSPDLDPESGPGKKVKFKQEEVEEEGAPNNLQPPSNLASTTAKVRNITSKVEYQTVYIQEVSSQYVRTCELYCRHIKKS